jgi:hypothetical protein
MPTAAAPVAATPGRARVDTGPSALEAGLALVAVPEWANVGDAVSATSTTAPASASSDRRIGIEPINSISS